MGISLESALAELAPQIGHEADELIAYAYEDTVGGFGQDRSGKVIAANNWVCGSLWHVEGQVLYALIRALKPENILEVGSFHGCSTTHILTALARNKSGLLTSVDLYPDAAANIPEHLISRWSFFVADAVEWVDKHPDHKFDFVFEDASHLGTLVAKVMGYVEKRGGKVFISHDGTHFLAGKEVQQGFKAVFPDMRLLSVDPADCGFCYYIKPEGA